MAGALCVAAGALAPRRASGLRKPPLRALSRVLKKGGTIGYRELVQGPYYIEASFCEGVWLGGFRLLPRP